MKFKGYSKAIGSNAVSRKYCKCNAVIN